MEEKKEEKRPGISRRMYYILLAIFGTAFLLGLVYVGAYFYQTGSASMDYADLEDIYLQGGTERPSGVQSSEPAGSQEPTMLPSLQPIYELNNDTVGYLHFPDDVGVSYPVMQSPYDEEFYLEHKFDRTPNVDVDIGCPFVPLNCDVFEPTDSVIIYGHNLRSGGMFRPLEQYRDKSFWEEHQYFYFDTLYERHTYQIFAVFKTAARQRTKDGDVWGYPYHKQTEFDSPEAFDQFISDVKGEAFETGGYQGACYYETGISPQYGDKLLCLSTCEYTIRDPYTGDWDGRLVIMAVRVD